MSLVFSNQGGSVLSIGISDSAPTVDVVDASSFPDLSGEETFYLVLENTARTVFEVCLATAVNKGANQITVTRGVGGTTAVPFIAGDFAENRLTKTTLESLIQSLPESGIGSVVDNVIKLSQTQYDALTPNPTSLYMIPGAVPGPGAAGFFNVQVLKTVEVADYVPTPGTVNIFVEMVGSGGGGAGCRATGAIEASCGNGGGGGGYAAGYFAIADIGDFEYKVGTGGLGGIGQNNGAQGKICYFCLDLALAFSLLSVSGGGGAPYSQLATATNAAQRPTAQGLGGIANDGQILTRGQHGGDGIAMISNALYASGLGGAGGNSKLGEGARSAPINGGGAGHFGWAADDVGSDTGYGGGGGGAVNAASQSANNGGDGRQGIIIVYEYLN